VLAKDPEARAFPSGENATERTWSVCPGRVLLFGKTFIEVYYAFVRRGVTIKKFAFGATLVLGLAGVLCQGAERHQYGDLVLRGTQSLVVDAETLYVHGNVYLYDSANLTVQNGGAIIIVQTYHEEFNFYLQDNAKLLIRNGKLDANFDICCVVLWGHSSLVADNAYIDHELAVADTSTAMFKRTYVLRLDISQPGYQHGWAGTSSTRLEDCRVHEMNLSFAQSCEVSLVGIQPGKGISFSVTQKDVARGQVAFELFFVKSDLERIDLLASNGAMLHLKDAVIFQLNCIENATVVAEDSSISQPVLQMSNVYATIEGLPIGLVSERSLKPTQGWIPCKMTLRNTRVEQGWYLRLRGGRIEIRDSVLARLKDEFDDPGSQYRLVNCCILEWMPWWDHGTVILENCILKTIQTPDGATPTLKGNFCVLDHQVSEFWGPWRNDSTITRVFPVIVKASNGQPAANVAVELLDSTGKVVQTQYTNSSGEASLTLVFNERNYRNTWIVRVTQFGWQQPLTLCSSTPIVFPPTPSKCPELPCRNYLWRN
jgi:hypothetical protein